MYLKEVLTQIALKWGYRLQEKNINLFYIQVNLVRDKVNNRFQVVSVQRESVEGKPSRIYLQSYCGIVTPKTPLYDIMRLALRYNYCTSALLEVKGTDGNPVTELIVQACPEEEYLTPELLDNILFEVADKADYLVMQYYEDPQPKLN